MRDYTSSMVQTLSTSKIRTKWSELGVPVYVKILIITILFYCLFHNEIYNIVHKWVTNSSWSHGFIIPLFSLYFLNQTKKDILNLQAKPNYLGLLFLLCAILFYPFNIVHFRIGYFNPLVMIPTLGAIVLFLGGWKLVKYTWLPIVYLVFAIPLPDRYYRSVTIPMRQWAATISAALLDMVKDLDATANGVVIDVIYKGQRVEPAIDVAEACSGMRLLMAFLALGAAMAYLHYRPIWQRIILLSNTIPIAIFCNIVRVAVTCFIYILIDARYAQGIYHDLLGLCMLPLAFGLYGFIAWFMSNLLVEEKDTEPVKEDVIVRKDNK